MAIDEAEVRRRLDGVIAALKAAGLWTVPSPSPEAVAAAGAFGGDAMSFEQWLVHVFVPSVESRLAEGGPWPTSSAVSVRATREADGVPELEPVVDALRIFDEVFEPESAKVLYDRAHSLQAEGRWDEAIAAAERSVALDDAYPNAHNYAGWLLWKKPGADAALLERALAHFARAVELTPAETAPAANHADVLLALGRIDEAFAWMETRTHDPASAPSAHNWIGYWRLQRGEADAALEHLRAAVRLRPTWGVPRINLAEVLERTKQGDEMFDLLDPDAHRFDDDKQRSFANERRGAYAARKGWLRSGLSMMRRAVVAGERGHSTRLGEQREGERYLAAMLRAHGIWAPSFELERRWIAARDHETKPTKREARSALEEARTVADTGALRVIEELLRFFGDAVPTTGPSAEGIAVYIDDPKVGHAIRLGERWLAEHWARAATREIPPERTMRTEEGKPLPPAVLEAEKLAREGSFARAAEVLETPHVDLIDAIGVAERAGDAAFDADEPEVARRLWAIALRGARAWASCATSGGEGLARMEDVHRLEAKV